jgi:hypothetical protein
MLELRLKIEDLEAQVAHLLALRVTRHVLVRRRQRRRETSASGEINVGSMRGRGTKVRFFNGGVGLTGGTFL